MASTFASREDSTGVVMQHEFLFLYNLVEHRPIHLGYVLANFLAHQGQHVCPGAIFADPYIT